VIVVFLLLKLKYGNKHFKKTGVQVVGISNKCTLYHLYSVLHTLLLRICHVNYCTKLMRHI